MKKYLFFDTETTGLPRNWKAPVSDLENWPRLVQIAWLQYDASGKQISGGSHIIRPDGFIIPADAVRIHGISTKRARDEGAPLKTVLGGFSRAIEQSDIIIAHNMNFDEKIVGAEFLRQNVTNGFSGAAKICTMRSSTDFCRIPGPYGNKWPTLSELHLKLFGTDFEEAHDASVDVAACARCFFELKRLKAV